MIVISDPVPGSDTDRSAEFLPFADPAFHSAGKWPNTVYDRLAARVIEDGATEDRAVIGHDGAAAAESIAALTGVPTETAMPAATAAAPVESTLGR